MVQGLTLPVALFLCLIVVPGYMFTWASGVAEEGKRNFTLVFSRGVVNFAVGIILIFLLFHDKAGEVLLMFSGDLQAIQRFFWLAMCGFSVLASVLGAIQLFLDTQSARAIKQSIVWRNFMAGKQFEVSPRENIMWEVLLCYRVIQKRPIVTVLVEGTSTPVQGEVLKASWGSKGGLLVAGMDDPQSVTWIPKDRIITVRYMNPGLALATHALDPVTKNFLNLVHPGYGEEVEQRLFDRSSNAG
ncbi:hypothetical protein MGLY_27780 [Neomoorella glycerini]|uniref:Uncharacterized protein n=1 Tax=Neomoorella glycerini TaxID=55779 RepID=A0A6I5ZTX1_9FIRM|nr:hypothetical protein [Moorella glycerini]QGP93370.1 hypothetical protein MGLY_27780 [Moorella glycerini]